MLSLRIGKTVKTIAIVPIKIKHVKQSPFNQILYLLVTDFETRTPPHRATLGEVRVDSVKDCTSIKLAHTAWALKKNLLTCKKQGRFLKLIGTFYFKQSKIPPPPPTVHRRVGHIFIQL